MQNHEKKAFLKFFITYFISVAILILVAGFFYISQIKNHLLRMEEFSLIEYARHIKMGASLDEFSDDFHYIILPINEQHIDIRNFSIAQNEFSKIIPQKFNHGYIKVFKSKKHFDEKLSNLQMKVILFQLLLLILFAYISYKLAKSALKPMQESIFTLDKFAKDLIHDLNTPVTSIKLNMKLLQKNPQLQNNNAITRLNKSVHTISELHENLTILLQEETFQMQIINICEVVEDVVQIQKTIYPDIKFIIECVSFKEKVNKQAIKQILQNIISNACKYNTHDGYVKIYAKNHSLYIEDSGKGIEEPQKIFDRAYSGEHSSGIGLDIVKRLAHAMNITIEVQSKTQGTIFILTMR